MRLPATVRITSKIKYDVLSSPCIGELHGICDFEKLQIVINPHQSNTEAHKTLIHEILHAVSNEYDAGLTENQVRALEEGLYKLFKLNKDLRF